VQGQSGADVPEIVLAGTLDVDVFFRHEKHHLNS
jgi:hypothetical protein